MAKKKLDIVSILGMSSPRMIHKVAMKHEAGPPRITNSLRVPKRDEIYGNMVAKKKKK